MINIYRRCVCQLLANSKTSSFRMQIIIMTSKPELHTLEVMNMYTSQWRCLKMSYSCNSIQFLRKNVPYLKSYHQCYN